MSAIKHYLHNQMESQIIEIEEEMRHFRNEVAHYRIQLKNAYNCLNALQKRRLDLIKESNSSN